MDEINVGDYVVCINNLGMNGALKEGDIYVVKSIIEYAIDDIQLEVLNNKGVFGQYYSTRFKKDKEMIRNVIIDEILS